MDATAIDGAEVYRKDHLAMKQAQEALRAALFDIRPYRDQVKGALYQRAVKAQEMVLAALKALEERLT